MSPHRGSRGDGGIDGRAVSGASVQTPFWGQNDRVFGGSSSGDSGIARGEANTWRMQIPKSGICNSSTCDKSADERAVSHKHATTSWRCGFEWVAAILRSRLRAWDVMVAEDCDCSIDDSYAVPFSFKYVDVDAHNVPHIIRRGERIIHQLETVCGVFLTLTDLKEGSHEMLITSSRPTCIFADFSMELLSSGHHSTLTTLRLSLPLGPLPRVVCTVSFENPLWIFVVCSILPWFRVSQSLPWFSLSIVGLTSFLHGFNFVFFVFHCLGGSEVLSHEDEFSFIIADISANIRHCWNIMLYMVRRWSYIAYSSEKAPRF